METGYIKLWRKSKKSKVFVNSNLWKVWCWCLMKANHKGGWATIKTGRGIKEVYLDPGQFVFGRKTAAKELNMKPSSVRNYIEKLKKFGNLDTQPDTHYTIIIIINWYIYQEEKNKQDSQVDNQRTTKGQPKDTNKNVKNVKNKYNEGFLKFYSAYPLKKSKAKAFQSWQKLKPNLTLCLNAIKNQIAEKLYLKSKKMFCPEWKHPSTWLNQQCWEDEIQIEPKKIKIYET